MKRAGAIALVLLAATAFAAAAAGEKSASPTAERCGGQLWRLKTLSDPQRDVVNLNSQPTTIADIGKRAYPRPVPTRRRTPFQRQAWEVVAQITRYRIEAGGVRLDGFDKNSYLHAVIPSLDCLSGKTRARDEIAAAYKLFMTDCAKPSTGWQPLGAVVHVRGVGFWSQRRGLRGTARNGAELHPVTGFRVIAGC